MQRLSADHQIQAVARATREGLLSEPSFPLTDKSDRALIA